MPDGKYIIDKAQTEEILLFLAKKIHIMLIIVDKISKTWYFFTNQNK